MNFPPGNLSPFHNDILQETLLGRLCGRKILFRDSYEILRMLGRGGFGVTFLARNVLSPGKPFCVIKQLCPQVNHKAALESARKRFKREAQILSNLGHHKQGVITNMSNTVSEWTVRYYTVVWIQSYSLLKLL